ncbi:calcium/sodium antiporter [Litorisediminicola beolgyonensis]|uniref:Calcium/sodium antiporter n=1 Tax=Litorisediminicola beolgyonensis TaxID=1173614 RepID=A0ABW3ZH87_9RHOB
MDVLLIAAGLPALLFGGEWLVSGAVTVAQRLRVSPLVIGLTLVGFGTSMPELITSLRAASLGSPGIALGNVVGSNIANILLILGLAAAIRPVAVDRSALRRDGGWVLAAALAVAALSLLPMIGRGAGLALVLALGLFLWTALRSGSVEAAPDEAQGTLPGALMRFGLGLALVLSGAVMLVEGAIGIARAAGVSETVIGLTLVAVGTSLPELVTSVVAARRGHGAVALGNVLGSNVFNVLGILGVTALALPLPVDEQIARLDVWVMLAATLVLLVFCHSGARLSRREGWALLLGYVAYLGWLSRTF